MRDREYEVAAARFPSLARFVCSAPWLLAIVVSGDENLTKERFREMYPPGRRETRMRRCPGCQRLGPPNNTRRECCDCEMEAAGHRFDEQIKRATCEVERMELTKRWWSRPFGAGSLITNPLGGFSAHDYPEDDPVATPSELGGTIDEAGGAEPPTPPDELLQGSIYIDRESMAHAAQCRFGRQSTAVRFCEPISMSALSRLPFGVAAAICSTVRVFDRCQAKSARCVAAELRRDCQPLGQYQVNGRGGVISLKYQDLHFRLLHYRSDYPYRTPHVGSGRAAGCEATLLPDTNRALKKEIAHYRKLHKTAPKAPDWEKLLPSVKRFTRLNPFQRAVEDDRSILDCFVTRRPPDEVEEGTREVTVGEL